MTTITYLYDTYDAATRAVDALEAAGIPHSDISLVGNNAAGAAPVAPGLATTSPTVMPPSTPASSGLGFTTSPTLESGMADEPGAVYATTPTEGAETTGAGAGASIGTILGGGAGLLAGIGALAIPGVGPVVAAGWLIATLTGAGVGAAAGGLIGSLTGAGVPEHEAHVYAEGVRRGGTLLTVRTSDARADEVRSIMTREGGHVDIATRGAEYRSAGWERFDDTLPPTGTPAL